MANNHIIQKQVLEVEMENPPDAFQFRNRLGEVFHEMILPRLTVLFDELGTENKTYRIESLTIDAGTIAKQNWEELLADKIIAEARQAIQLKDPVWKAPVSRASQGKPTQAVLPHELMNANATHKETDRTQTDLNKTSQEFYEVFETYLTTGYLSWYAGHEHHLKEGFAQSILPEKPLVKRLANYLKTANSTAIQRLVYLLPYSFLNKLIEELLNKKLAGFLKDFLQLTYILEQIILQQSASELHIKKSLYLPFFKWLAVPETININDFIAAQTVKYFQLNLPMLLPKVSGLVNDHNNFLLKTIIETLQIETTKKLVHPDIEQNEMITEQPDELFISNAGLVILHPFLPQLFQELQLTYNNKFVDELACMKAILISRFIAGEDVAVEDHDLAIEKILCGKEPDEPILCNIELSENDKKEAIDLLAQIIQLWKQNGVQVNGTIEGFQQSFLQRQGKLTKRNTDWRLQVQQLSYDMVLSSLPWSISMVKTPLMKGMLWIEWA